MMCEHEFVQEEWIVEVCDKCDKLRFVIDLEQQLAAANSLIESQNEKIEAIKAYDLYLRDATNEAHLLELAAANARVAEMEAEITDANKKLDTRMVALITAQKGMADWREIAEQAEAQCAAMLDTVHALKLGMDAACSCAMSFDANSKLRISAAKIRFLNLDKQAAGTALLEENRRMREALEGMVNWCKSSDQENGVELQYVLHRAQRGLKGSAE